MFNFESQTTRYSSWNAYWLGQAAKLVYEDEPKIKKTLELQYQLPQYKFIDREATGKKTGTQCFVAGDDKKIIVSFRGTETDQLEDIVTDIKLCFDDGPLGKVHHGFLTGVNDVWDELVDTLNKFQNKGQSLWFTGHSLGAALAHLTVAKLIDDFDFPIYGLYTFGQPRVGDKKFTQNFNLEFKSRYFRFVNNNDVVTRVPLRSMNYSHAGNFLYFDPQKVIHSDLHWWYLFLNDVQGVLDDFGKKGLNSIKDHNMSDYLAGLEKNKQTPLQF